MKKLVLLSLIFFSAFNAFAIEGALKGNFTVTRDDWHQKFKDAEKAAAARERQMKFKGVSQSVSERMANPTYQTIDRQGFAQQSKYTTLRGYVFKKCWDAYDD